MNSLTAEKRYQFAKWAEIIKSCKSSGMQVSEWLKQNNISKDQYYYWQRKLKDACLESLQAEQSTFVELPVEVPQICEHKPVVKKATIKTNPKPIIICLFFIISALLLQSDHKCIYLCFRIKKSITVILFIY